MPLQLAHDQQVTKTKELFPFKRHECLAPSHQLNGLIERAVGERSAGWGEFMDQPRRRFKSKAAEVRKASR